MALKLADKKSIVAEVNEVAQQSLSLVIADYRGLSSAQMTTLRAQARGAGVRLRVVRNTLAKRAFEGTEFSCATDVLAGPVILAFAEEEPGAPARLVRDFMKDHEHLEVKGIAINGNLLKSNQLDVLANLPTREEALAKLLSVMQAPIAKLVRTLAAPQSKLVRTLVAVKDQKQTEQTT